MDEPKSTEPKKLSPEEIATSLRDRAIELGADTVIVSVAMGGVYHTGWAGFGLSVIGLSEVQNDSITRLVTRAGQ